MKLCGISDKSLPIDLKESKIQGGGIVLLFNEPDVNISNSFNIFIPMENCLDIAKRIIEIYGDKVLGLSVEKKWKGRRKKK